MVGDGGTHLLKELWLLPPVDLKANAVARRILFEIVVPLALHSQSVLINLHNPVAAPSAIPRLVRD